MRDTILLACGLAAGPLFTIAYLLEGAARAGYRPLRHPVSSLALGPAGWTQRANFVITGLLTLAFTAGMWLAGPSRAGATLIGVWAAGLVAAGLFRTDPVSGYPPGTPDRLDHPTRAGAAHDGASLVGFLALTAACLVYATTGAAVWAGYSAASGVVFAATMALAGVAFAQHPRLVAHGGLVQRASITVGLAWMTVLAARVLIR